MCFSSVVCNINGRRSRYHPAVWAARRWACCDAERRSALGCNLADVWPLPEFEPDEVEAIQEKNKQANELARKQSQLFIVCSYSGDFLVR